jgi:transcriptional regulator with XRE-family HTH domain
MSKLELRKTMRKLGCHGHQDLANLIGVNRSTVSIWLLGKVSVPKPIAMLLRLLLEQKIGTTRA